MVVEDAIPRDYFEESLGFLFLFVFQYSSFGF